MARAFRMKRIGGSVVPARQFMAITARLRICLLRTAHCLPWTPSPPVVDPEIYAGQLAALKADLRDALADIERHQNSIARIVAEGSRLAVAQLEEGLNDALQQLERMKTRSGTE